MNENEVHAFFKDGAYSIINNVPAPKITNNGSMANVEADQPKKFALMQVDDVAIMRDINEDMSDMKKHDCLWQRTSEKNREITKNCPKDGKERYFVGIKGFRD